MNEDIKILENVNALFIKGKVLTDISSLRNLIAGYKELEKENKILKNKQTKIIADSFHEKMAKKFDDDFIKKSKIKEKIEELNNKIDGDDYWKYSNQDYVGMQYQVKVLQELLDE